MGKKLSSIILCVALLFVPQFLVLGANQVNNIEIQAVIQEDGSMNITQNWKGRFDEGTEIYIPMKAPNYLTIHNLVVSDENGSYETVDDWNINWSFEEKARKCV